jgi:hypothetical protein
MPYQPILNPIYYHWEPWPHVYRRGGWIHNVTGHQAPVRIARTVVPTGLGEAPPWQCWDQPGFKECQSKCFDKAQQTGLTADAQSALIDQCFNTECIEPCRKTLALTTDAGSSTTTKTVDDWLAKVTPMNIAIGAVLIAIGSTLLMPPKKTKKNKRGSR